MDYSTYYPTICDVEVSVTNNGGTATLTANTTAIRAMAILKRTALQIHLRSILRSFSQIIAENGMLWPRKT